MSACGDRITTSIARRSKNRKSVLKSHAELADHLRIPALLRVFVLRQVLVTDSPAICHVPAAVTILEDRRLLRSCKRLLIQRISNQLADR
jgi:hypothetical protein